MKGSTGETSDENPLSEKTEISLVVDFVIVVDVIVGSLVDVTVVHFVVVLMTGAYNASPFSSTKSLVVIVFGS